MHCTYPEITNCTMASAMLEVGTSKTMGGRALFRALREHLRCQRKHSRDTMGLPSFFFCFLLGSAGCFGGALAAFSKQLIFGDEKLFFWRSTITHHTLRLCIRHILSLEKCFDRTLHFLAVCEPESSSNFACKFSWMHAKR